MDYTITVLQQGHYIQFVQDAGLFLVSLTPVGWAVCSGRTLALLVVLRLAEGTS